MYCLDRRPSGRTQSAANTVLISLQAHRSLRYFPGNRPRLSELGRPLECLKGELRSAGGVQDAEWDA